MQEVAFRPRLVLRQQIALAALLLAAIAAGCAEGTDPGATGVLEVGVQTQGLSLDPDGYIVVVDGVPGPHVAVNGTAVLAGVSAGMHGVSLSGLANNCAVYSELPVQVSVPAGGEVALALAVICQGSGGFIRVETVTGGTSQDPDGYTVSIDGGAALPIGRIASLTFPSLLIGEHTVQLAGMAPNCQIAVANPQVVAVLTGQVSLIRFSVSCVAVPNSFVAYPYLSELRIARWDGTESQTVLTGYAPLDIAWHPSREWIAITYGSPAQLLLVRIDGSELRVLGSPESSQWPSFSPDGNRIVFATEGCGQLMTVNIDGSARAPVLADPRCQRYPDWSPDGSAIVFSLDNGIARVGIDGTGLVILRESGARPAWSPDGTRILFSEFGGIVTMNPDGTDARRVGSGNDPVWSPDGSSILFSRIWYVPEQGFYHGAYLMNADGTSEQISNVVVEFGRSPVWAP